MKCHGKRLPIGVAVNPLTGLVLGLDGLPAGDAQSRQAFALPILQGVGARVLVTDGADALKAVSDG